MSTRGGEAPQTTGPGLKPLGTRVKGGAVGCMWQQDLGGGRQLEGAVEDSTARPRSPARSGRP